jgi:hypothetical protein
MMVQFLYVECQDSFQQGPLTYYTNMRRRRLIIDRMMAPFPLNQHRENQVLEVL